MKSPNLRLATLIGLLISFGSNIGLKAQTIDEVIIPGATTSNSGGTWNVEFFSSTNTTTNADNYKEIKLVQTGTKGEYIIWDATSGSSDWEIVQGQPGGGSWFNFCKPMLENDQNCDVGKTCTTSYYVRHIGTTTGSFNATIKVGLSTATSNKSNTCQYDNSTAFTVEATVNKVAATGIYTWSEPTSGTDSSYKIAGNWTPTRTTPSTDDVLVVDLSQGSNRSTTIYMDGVNESIDQFIIYPYNYVTFKCSTTSNSANWTVGKTSSTAGDDFRLDTLAGMSISGGTIDLNIPSGNTAMFKSKLNLISGTLDINGPGTITHRSDIATLGGNLNYKSSAITTLNLAGKNTKLSGTGGSLYIDSTVNVKIGNGATSSFTLERVLPIISNLELLENTTLISNAPTSYTDVTAVNSWTPYLQLKATAKANSTAHGQLIEMPTGTNGASITGGAQFEIFNNKQRAYRAFGIPLNGGTMIPQFTDDIDVTGTVTGSNANDFTTSCSWCTHSLFQWNESSSAWSPYTSENSVTTIPLGTGILTFFRGAKGNGLGDTTVVANEKVLDFKGQLAIGDKTITINNSGSGSLKGYNLVGNPYPCTIDLRTLYEDNRGKILPRFYLYDAISRRYNEWDSVGKNGNAPTRNGTSKFGNNGNRNRTKFLAAGAAAFMIYDGSSSSQTITFKETQKFDGAKSATQHFSSGIQEESMMACNELKGELRYQNSEAPENDGFTIEFDMPEYATVGDKYDMNKLYAGYVGFGTLTENNWWLSIDRRGKIAEIGETKSIPLKVAYPKEGPSTMEISLNTCNESNRPYDIQLFDKLKNTVSDVNSDFVYAFNAGTAEEKKADRFELLFTGKSQQNNTSNIRQNDFNVFPNPSENGIFYILNNHSDKGTYQVFGINGQLLSSGIIQAENKISSIDLSELSKGIYILKTINKDSIQTQKIELN